MLLIRFAGLAACAGILQAAPGVDTRLDILAKAVQDDSPRVRLEALRSLAGIPSTRSAELALSVLDKPMDLTLDYALWLTINDLAEPWIAALQSGAWKPEGREKQLEFALKAIKPEQTSRVLGVLLGEKPLPKDGSGPWIELIGSAGSPRELHRLYEQVLAGGFDGPAGGRALRALSDAARFRDVRPEGNLASVARLLGQPDPMRLEAIRLAGHWRARTALDSLLKLSGDESARPEIRSASFASIRQIGGASAASGLITLLAEKRPFGIHREAVIALFALAAVDRATNAPSDQTVSYSKAAEIARELARTAASEAEALELWRGLLSIKGASTAIREALEDKELPAVAARAGLRAAREAGRDDVELVLAFAKAGRLATDTAALTGEMLKELAAKATTKGDPHRGEFVYRRSELACMTCHAIGGAGGKVGPDLTSIGASAPPDYLVEALLLPNAKIKEGYHSVNLETKDGQSLTGTLARETPDEVALRNAAGAEIRVAKSNIESRANGTLSLMPTGLMDNLSEQDRLDLIAFLTRLGQPGEFDASRGGVARQWRVRTFTHTDQQHGRNNDAWEKPFDDKSWQSATTLVSGRLTKSVLQEAGRREFWVGTLSIFAATELQTAKAGRVKLNLDASAGELWIGGGKVGGVGESQVELPAGKHRVLVRFDSRNVPDYMKLESPDGSFVME